jgi:hypothetical protein
MSHSLDPNNTRRRYDHYRVRVSTTDQNLDVQENALLAVGCDLIRFEKDHLCRSHRQSTDSRTGRRWFVASATSDSDRLRVLGKDPQ